MHWFAEIQANLRIQPILLRTAISCDSCGGGHTAPFKSCLAVSVAGRLNLSGAVFDHAELDPVLGKVLHCADRVASDASKHENTAQHRVECCFEALARLENVLL